MTAISWTLVVASALLALCSVGLLAPLLLEARRERVRRADAALARRAASYAISGAAEEKPGNHVDDERFSRLAAKLHQAGIKATPVSWLTRLAIVALLAFSIAWVLLASLAAGIAAALAVTIALFAKLEAGAKSRTKRFESQLSDALPMMAENLRAGQAPARSLLTVAEYMDDPLREEFERAAREMGYGVPFSQAMDDMFKRVPCEDLRLLNGVVAINAESGGDLSDLLDSIAETMQMRARMRAHVSSITASGRLSAAIVAALPLLIVVGLWLTSPGYLAPMFESGFVGYAILAVVAVMDVLGFLVIKSMFKIDID